MLVHQRVEFRENSVMLRGWNMVKLISLMQSMKNNVFFLTIDQASLADIHANRGELYVQLIDIQQRENTAFLNLLNLHRISLKFPKCFLVEVGHDSSRSSENRWPRRCSEFQNPPFASQVMISTLLVCLTNDCRYCIWLSGSIPFVGKILCVYVFVFSGGFLRSPDDFCCRTLKMSPRLWTWHITANRARINIGDIKHSLLLEHTVPRVLHATLVLGITVGQNRRATLAKVWEPGRYCCRFDHEMTYM